MNKTIKYTIAALLVINAFSGTLPAKDFTFGNIEVYATTDEELDTEHVYLKSIYLSDGNILQCKC